MDTISGRAGMFLSNSGHVSDLGRVQVSGRCRGRDSLCGGFRSPAGCFADVVVEFAQAAAVVEFGAAQLCPASDVVDVADRGVAVGLSLIHI